MKTWTKFALVVWFIFQLSKVTFGQIADSSQTGIFKAGNWELNFSASIGNLNTSSKSSSSPMMILTHYSISNSALFPLTFLLMD